MGEVVRLPDAEDARRRIAECVREYISGGGEERLAAAEALAKEWSLEERMRPVIMQARVDRLAKLGEEIEGPSLLGAVSAEARAAEAEPEIVGLRERLNRGGLEVLRRPRAEPEPAPEPTVPRKFLSAWEGQLPIKLMMISNEVPNLNDPSGALPARIITLQLRHSFLGREDGGADRAQGRARCGQRGDAGRCAVCAGSAGVLVSSVSRDWKRFCVRNPLFARD